MSNSNSPNWSTSLLGKRSRNHGHVSRDSNDASPSSGELQRNEIYSSGPSPPLSANAGTHNSSPFACTYDECAKTFATAAHRKRHERTHTGVLPYGCPLCGKRFARSDVRSRHITGIHEKDPAKVLKGIETGRGKSGELSGDAPHLPQQSSSKRQSPRSTPSISNHSQGISDVPKKIVQQHPRDASILPSTLASGSGGPCLTNDRIVSQILRPAASLPSPGQMGGFQQNFPSPRDHEHRSSHDTYPSSSMNTSFGITTQDPFPQPNLANLAGPAPHPSMEMLLQAVSTSTPSWSGPSMAERQPRPAFYHGNMNAITSVPQSSQIPTGYINLGLPTDSSSLTQPEQAYSTEEGIADVFGWGVDSADWMQLYDSMGMDSNLVAPADLAQMLQPHTQSQTVFTPQHPVYMPSATTGSSAWMAGQILHSNSATPPSSINDHPRYASIRIDRPYHSPEEPSSRDPSDSVDYRIPSELPDNREAYPSTTSRINRDIKSISAVQYGAGAAGSLNYDMVPGTRTRHATEDLSQVPGEEQRPNAVLRAPSNKRTLALPEPVMQHPSYVGHHPIYVGTKHHTALLRLINLTHEPTFLPPDLTNFPNPGVMSTCVGLYFEHFHPVMPVLRPEAFRDIDRYLSARDQGEEGIGVDFDVQSSGSGGGTSTGPPASNILEYQSHPYYPFLLLTMCAIGATYAKQDWKSMAIYMNELARRAGKHLRDRDSRAVFSKQYMQARLLQAVAGLAIGSRDLYLESEMTRSILVSAARRSNLLRPSKAHANTPPPAFSQPNVELSLSDVRPESIQLDDSQRADERENEAELELRWYKWLEEEERRRLGWGIYIADSQGASILNVPATFALDEIHAALPSTKELWIAPSAAAWYAAVKRAHRAEPTSAEPQPFSRVLRETLQEGTLPRTVSDFGKNIIAHTLYRICIEASALNKLLVGDSASISHDVRHGSFPPNLKYDPYTLLERLGVSWHDSVEHPSYFLITNDALRHHAYYKLVHPQFLDQVKYAAGQWESDASKSTARQWLTEWTAVNPADSRRVMAHSAQMAALLSRFTWDACWEPVWVLDCCLAMWAVVKFGGKEVLNMSEGDEHGLSSRKTTVKWSDAPDRVEEWVVSGGPTAFQGMQWEFTPRNILTDFMARLEAMPWNVSKLYRSVLGRLLVEEDELERS